MKSCTSFFVASLGMFVFTGCAISASDINRTPDGKPDLSGTFDAATLTPLERPAHFGDRLFLTREEVDSILAAEKVSDKKSI